jgi:periplasmic divalent cation tolerance protein
MGNTLHKVLWFVNKKTQYGVNMGNYIVCLVTIDDPDKALEISKKLVNQQLVACVNIVPEIRSIYRWKGEICDNTERLLIMKTQQHLYSKLEKTIHELHAYEVPEIIAFNISHGLPDYLSWIDDCTRTTD